MKCKQCNKNKAIQPVSKSEEDYSVGLCEQCKDIYEFELLMRNKYGLQVNVEVFEDEGVGVKRPSEPPMDASEL